MIVLGGVVEYRKVFAKIKFKKRFNELTESISGFGAKKLDSL